MIGREHEKSVDCENRSSRTFIRFDSVKNPNEYHNSTVTRENYYDPYYCYSFRRLEYFIMKAIGKNLNFYHSEEFLSNF